MSNAVRRPWLRPLLIAVAALVVVAVIAVTVVVLDPFGPRATTQTRVGPEGFTASVVGVTVTGPAGVAPEGTVVTLTTIDAPLPGDVAAFAGVAGVAVEIELGDGLQPAAPLQARFELDPGVDPATAFVLGEDPATGTGVAFTDSTTDADASTVTAQLDHLSWFAPVSVDAAPFSERVRAWIDEYAGTGSAPPDCFGRSDAVGPQFGTVPDDVVWPCVTSVDEGIGWELHSNSGLVWEVLTDPVADFEPLTTLTLPGVATAALANRLLEAGALEGDAVVLPLETLRGTLPGESGGRFALRVEPGLSQVATLVFGLSMIFPSKWLDLVARAECLVDVVKIATSSPSGESLRAILSCVAAFLEGTGGAILGILLTGPGLLANQLEGLAREISQTNTVEFRLGHRDANQVDALPGGAVWLSELPQEIVPNPAEAVAAVVPVDGADVVFANSSSVWVGCGGDAHEVWFYLDGEYSTLSFALGLQEHTPEALTAEFTVETVGQEWRGYPVPSSHAELAGEWRVTRGTLVDREELAVDDVWIVIVRARTSDSCGMASIGYGALLDAYVE